MNSLAETRVIPSDLLQARQLEESILEEVSRHGYGDTDSFAIKLALEEGLNNAIRHGNGQDPAKTVEVQFEITDEKAVITISDQGKGFCPECVPDCTAEENLEKPSGRGIMLIHAYMDEVTYNETGNQVRMVKHKS